jgi:dipeptidyl aminopeptidase/acylaminoacyl peptidase
MSFARGRLRCTRAALVSLAAVSSPSLLSSQQPEPPIIPRAVLFGNPERVFPQVSPDGRMLAYLAPDSGVLNVWVRTIGKRDDRPVTHDRTRPIFQYYWQGDSRHVLHLQDRGGDENWRLFQTDVATGKTRDFTPNDSVQTQIIAVDPGFPSEILVAWNMRDRRYHDAYRLDLTTGRRTLVASNPGDVGGWLADNRLQVRAATATLPDGGTELRTRSGNAAEWRAVRRESPDETFSTAAGFTPDNRGLWLLSSVGANAARLLRMDAASGATSSLAEDSVFDATGILVHPTSHALQAVQFTRQRLEWQAIDSAVSADLRTLQGVRDGDFTIDSRDRADRKWIVTYVVSDGPVAFYLYERPSRRATLLFVHRPALERYTLARMEPVAFAARDSLRLYGYLTLPPGKEPKRLPLVMLVHGGPWGRDVWGYNPDVQWLANRGYAVLQVNYRGSTGYGKAHLNAGDREWAGKMHTDLLDAKAWAVERGYADPERTCIYGGSYGGYATLVGLAFTPGEFACGVDLVGPSNLVTLIQTIPPYWASFKAVIDKRLGKLGKDDEFLRARSPLFRADSIRAPLMIVQGANDPRVKQAESDQIVAAMRKNGQTVKYIVFPDEGHGFARPENKLRFYAAAEPFFAEYLGGRVEPAAAEEKVEPFVQ